MGECFKLHRAGGSKPKYTYTGTSELIDDGNGNWRIKFKTSGTLTFTSLGNARNGIDVFLVGGGASGRNFAQAPDTSAAAGGSGYTLTDKTGNIKPTKGTAYSITVGAAGNNSAGGSSTAFGKTASGGYRGSGGWNSSYDYIWAEGGNGGSGGGAATNEPTGGSDGYNGSAPESHMTAGKGQRNQTGPNGETGTTKEFGESGGAAYAQGGGKTTPYKANSGNGGCVYWTYPTTVTIAASSGIVVIRNHR